MPELLQDIRAVLETEDPRMREATDAEALEVMRQLAPDSMQDDDFLSLYKQHNPTTASLKPLPAKATTPRDRWPYAEPDRKQETEQPKESKPTAVQELAERADQMRKLYEARLAITADPATKNTLKQQYRAQLEQMGVQVLGDPLPWDNPYGKFVREHLREGVRLATDLPVGAASDIAETVTGHPTTENIAAAARGDRIPMEEFIEEQSGVTRFAGKAAVGAARVLPYLAGSSALARAGASPAVAAGVPLSITPEGFDPVSGAIGAGIPYAAKAGRALTASVLGKLPPVEVVIEQAAANPSSLIGKVVQKLGPLPKLESDLVRKAIEESGAAMAANAYLLATQTPAIAEMPEDKRGQAVLDFMAGNIAMSLLSYTSIFRATPSETVRNLRGRLEREWNKENFKPPEKPEPAKVEAKAEEPPPEPPAKPLEPTPTPPPTSPPATSQPASSPTPVTTPEGLVFGSSTYVRGSQNKQIEATYAWAPRSLLHASHKGEGFESDPFYSPIKNTRDYERDLSEREKVLLGAQNFDPESYAVNVKGAAEGPIMVARGSDGVYRVLGGNGRFQMMQRLSPEKLNELARVQNQEAAVFGLPASPSPEHVLVRLLPEVNLETSEGVSLANQLVDSLNPSPGLVETTSKMAENDAMRVPVEALRGVAMDSPVKEKQEWIQRLIADGAVDRNTRMQILSSSAQSDDYVQRMLVQAAYRDNHITNLRNKPRQLETVRGLIDAGVPLALELRRKGEPAAAGALTELFTRVAEYQNKHPERKLNRILAEIGDQREITDPIEVQLARGLGAVLAQEVELLPPNRRGESKVDAEETARNFRQVLQALSRAVAEVEPGPDMFGQSRSVADAWADWLKARLGVQLLDKGETYRAEPDPRVQRWRKLEAKRQAKQLSREEEQERLQLEADLGQSFMGFVHQQNTKELEQRDRAEQRREMEARARQRLRGAPLVRQEDLFSQAGEQMSLLDGRQDYFPGFDVPARKVANEEPKANTRVAFAQGPGSRQLQLGGMGPSRKQRSGSGSGIAEQSIGTARAELVPARTSDTDWLAKRPELKAKLRPHQVDGVQRTLDAFTSGHNFGLFDGTGAGKTMQELAVAILEADRTGSPSLIVTERQGIIDDAFAKDAETLGIPLYQYNGGPTTGQPVQIATYFDLQRGLIKPGQFRTVIFDEAHNLRGISLAIKAHVGMAIANAADRVLFATATPLDKPEQLWYLASLLKESPEASLRRVGIETSWLLRDGRTVPSFRVMDDINQGELERRLESLFDQIYSAGMGIKREVPLANLDVVLRRVPLDTAKRDEVNALVDQVAKFYRAMGVPERNIEGLSMMAGRGALEKVKVAPALELVETALKEGRQVVLFAYRAQDGKWVQDGSLEAISNELERRHGTGSVGRLFGGATTLTARRYKQQTLQRFSDGDLRVITATPASAGTGVNLDDIHGDAPREIIMLTPPFSAMELVQVAGRVNRLTTRSRARLSILTTESGIDSWNLGITLNKLATLKATVKGDIGSLTPQQIHDRRRRYKQVEGQLELDFAAGALAAAWRKDHIPGRIGNVGIEGPGSGVAGSRVTVFGRGINLAYLPPEGVNIVGKTIRTLAEAAAVFQAFRDPRVEVFRYVLMKGETVVGTYGLTARLPGVTFATHPTEPTYSIVAEMARKLGANGYFIVHNHPSGDPTPSQTDLQTTVKITEMLNDPEKIWNAESQWFKERDISLPLPVVNGFRGHIVIEGGRYSFIDAGGMHQTHKLERETNLEPDRLLTPPPGQPVDPKIFERFVDSPQMAALVGKQILLGDRYISLLFLTARNRVRALAEVPLAPEAGIETLAEELQVIAVSVGATKAVAHYQGEAVELAYDFGLRAVRKGILEDLVITRPDSSEWISARRAAGRRAGFPETFFGRKLGDPQDVMRIEDRGTDYHADKAWSSQALYASNAPIVPGKAPEVLVQMGGMDHVKPVEMPELVKLAKQLMGQLPRLKKMPSSRGIFHGKGRGRIWLDPRIFVDQTEAAKTLAHEIGHLIDYLPTETLQRGNLGGRLKTLQKFLKATFSRDPESDDYLTTEDRARLRSKAAAAVGPKPREPAEVKQWSEEVSRVYREMIEEELVDRGLIEVKQVREELMALTQFWKPFDDSTAPDWYLAYRYSSRELYADFLSVLLNSPGLAQQFAPETYEIFWDHLDRKPEVKEALFGLQDFLHRGQLTVLEQRQQDIEAMFSRGDELLKRKWRERQARAKSWRGWYLQLKQHLFDIYQPQVEKAQAAEKAGAKFNPAEDPRNILEEQPMTDNVNQRFVRRMFEGVLQPLEAAGISVEDLGQYLFLDRVMKGRSDIANPLGTTPATARLQMLKMRLDNGIEKMTLLERGVAKFHDLVFERVTEAVRVGAYNKQTFEETLLPSKDSYAAFAVLKYLEDYVPATIRQQIGTLEDVANPFTATVLKTITLNNVIMLQRAKNTTRDLLRRYFPREIQPAQTYWDGARHQPRKHAELAPLMILENGKPAFYNVDPLIAESFEKLSPHGLERVTRVLDWTFRRIFYPMFITYNPGFQFVANPIRDFYRTWRALPANVGRFKLAKAYLQTFKSAVSRMAGVPDPLATEMMANFAIGTPWDSFNMQHRTDQFGDLLRRYHMLPADDRYKIWESKWLAPLRKLGTAMEFAGGVVEALPKMAAYKIAREKLKMAPKEAAAEVRNYVGTPNIFKRGRSMQVVRAAVPFFNVFLQGWRADLKRMANPKTAGGWWWKWAISDGIMAVLTGLAQAGLFGAALQKLIEGISEYDKTNYVVVPVAAQAGGDFGTKITHLRIPRDETSRLISGMTYKLTAMMAGSNPRNVVDLFAFGADQLPGVNPMITIPTAWGEYLGGRNPEDPFRGRPIIPRTEFTAGGIDSLKPLAAWTIDQSGVSNFVRYDPEANTTLEIALGLIPGINRLLRTTDYGYRERQMQVERVEDRARARHKLSLPENAQRLQREYFLLRSISPENRTAQQLQRYEELAVWYNAVFRRLDEDIQLLEEAGLKTPELRGEMEQLSKAFEKEK